MKTLTWLVLSVLSSISLLFAERTAIAATYEVVFDEGSYKYVPASGANDVNNKYLARVTIRRDGSIVASGIRGSTLPDALALYERWNVELQHEEPPNDIDIQEIFQRLEQRLRDMRSSKQISVEIKRAVEGIVDALENVPVLKSGDYAFVMGLHKGGTGPHGHPYVPRLLGGTLATPYDPDNPIKATILGGFIRSLTKNNAQGQRYLASGINVHDGRLSRAYKDSEGCLTIRPQDWKAFYTALPSPDNWKNGQHVGVVRIKRGVQDQVPSARTNLAIE
jgi:hypothetical protein